MRRSYFAGASVIALGAALGIAGADAAGGPSRTLTVNIADYNAAQVAAAGDILSLPQGGTFAVYAVNQGSLEINSRFTVTLPPNFTFNSQPSLSASSTTTFALTAGGVGSQSATFTIGTIPLAAGQSVALNPFSVGGATALETPVPVVNALPLSMQASNNALVTNNDPAPLTEGAFASEPGAQAVFVSTPNEIDLTPPSLGTAFIAPFSSPPSDTTTALLAAIDVAPEVTDAATGTVPVLQPSGAPNALSTADTATVAVTGLFNGIASAFASTTDDCQSPTATGTVEPTQVTIPGVAANNNPAFICVTANGTTLLQQNIPNPLAPNSFAFNATVTAGTSTDFLSAVVNTESEGFWSYAGGGVVPVTNFFTGDDSGYSSLLRVNNAGTSSVTLFALAQSDIGGAPLAGSIGSLDAGLGTVFTEQQIAAATGLVLPNSGARATLQLIVSGDFTAVAASSLLVNPSGVVTNVGVQPNLPTP